jgi:hypothetical protein
VSTLLGLLGIDVQDPNTPIGITCTPIDSLGSCNQQAVCCQNNNFVRLPIISLIFFPDQCAPERYLRDRLCRALSSEWVGLD